MTKPTKSQIESRLLEILRNYLPHWVIVDSLNPDFVPCDNRFFNKSTEASIIKELEESLGVKIPLTSIFVGPCGLTSMNYTVSHAANVIFNSLSPRYTAKAIKYLNGLTVITFNPQEYYVTFGSYCKFSGHYPSTFNVLEVEFEDMEDFIQNRSKVHIPELSIIRLKNRGEVGSLISANVFGCWIVRDNLPLALELGIIRLGVDKVIEVAFNIDDDNERTTN